MTSSVKNTIALPPGALLEKARHIARAVDEHGGRAMLVGGYVRDALLGLDPKDADLEVYGIEADALRKLLSRFGRVNCVGESYRVYKLAWHVEGARWELDVSLPRHDKKVGAGHRGFEVEGDPHASFEEAARRRDFTLNAILCDVLTGEVIDPFGGRADLENKILRIVDARHFAEDSLRVLRAMQFAARFNLKIDAATMQLCQGISLGDLPRERIWGEWEKMLLKSRFPSTGVRVAGELGILGQLFPYLAEAVAVYPQEIRRSLNRAARWTDNLAAPRRITLLLTVLCCFIPNDALTFLDALHLYTVEGYDVRKQVLALLADARIPFNTGARRVYAGTSQRVTDGELRRVALRCDLRLLCMLARSLARSREEKAAVSWFWANIKRVGVEDGPPAPLLMGRHLLEMGLKPGKRIGEITHAVYEMQLNGDVKTLEDARAAAGKLIEGSLA